MGHDIMSNWMWARICWILLAVVLHVLSTLTAEPCFAGLAWSG
jgi:hypothetical protein